MQKMIRDSKLQIVADSVALVAVAANGTCTGLVVVASLT